MLCFVSTHPAGEEIGGTNGIWRGNVGQQKTPPAKAIYFADSQTAIDDLLDDWLPRLIESNEVLTAALVRVKGLCSVNSSPVVAERVLAEVEAALERSANAKNGL
jgi:hypothetical protein